jgi:hypothetical protein
MARVYWVTQDSVFLATENGVRLAFEEGSPAPPPDWLADVLRVRLIIGDPICGAVIYARPLPDAAPEGSCATGGDGLYYVMRDGEWQEITLQFQDGILRERVEKNGNVLKAAYESIKLLLIRINPLDYITGANAGGQSVSFPGVADVISFFIEKLKHISGMVNAEKGYTRACVPPYPVGGVYD